MKLYKNYLTRLPRVVKTGTVLGATLLVASALQAQSTAQNPASQDPAVRSAGGQLPVNQDPATADRTQTSPPLSSSTASTTEPSSISHRAKEFIKDAAEANQTEIAMANVAIGKTQNTQVKDLAQMLRDDHQKNYQQLEALAQAHGVKIDIAPDWLDQREVNHLQKASDADFDKEYTKMMIKDHVKCIKRFDKASSELGEQDIKQYAMDTLPTLRTHLRKSEDAARAVGVDESTIDSAVKGLSGEDQAVTTR